MFGISVSGIKNSQKHIDVTSNNMGPSIIQILKAVSKF